MTTLGKRNRKVSIVYPHYIKQALDSLVEYRLICGIKNDNPFLFADTALCYMRGFDVIREIVADCHSTCKLQKPNLIKSTLK